MFRIYSKILNCRSCCRSYYSSLTLCSNDVFISVSRPPSVFGQNSWFGFTYFVRSISQIRMHSASRRYMSNHDLHNNHSRDLNQSEQLTNEREGDGLVYDPNALLQNDDVDLFDDIDFEAITGGSEEALNKFKLLLLEVDVMRQDGLKVPSKLTTEQWKELLSLQTRSQHRKMLNFLFIVEMKKQGDKRKKEKRRHDMIERKVEWEKIKEENNHILYGFGGSTIFLRIYETAMNLFDNSRLVHAMLFGQNLVVDCGYDNNMSIFENKLCAKQLLFMFAENRSHKEPFNLHFCNLNKSSILYTRFKKSIPTIDDPGFPINVTEEHYLNLFPKEKLVYLTPHCRTEMREFNHDDIYIIGAMVDKTNTQPLSLARAKSEGIRMAQLPLDRYLDWNLGTKSLTINQVLSILLDIRLTGDWNFALRHVPRRKIRVPGEPVLDTRKYSSNRGTTFQPPPQYRRKHAW